LTIIQDTIQAAQVGEEATFRNLTIFPLIGSDLVERNYQILDEALAAGTSKVDKDTRIVEIMSTVPMKTRATK
jgi:hypothetical protein